MYHLQYYCTFVFFLGKIIVLINSAYNEDDKNDIKIFVDLLNKIPTWDQVQIKFNQTELKQIVGIIIDGVQNPEDVELNNKYETKITALKCTYGYAVQKILLDLRLLSNYEQYIQSQPNQTAHDNEIDPVDHNGSNEEVEPQKKKVRFNDEVKLLALDKNNTMQVSKIIKKKSVDLRNEMGFRTQNANEIVQNQPLDQEYIIELMKHIRQEDSNSLLSLCQMLVTDYNKMVNRMLSVMFMAKRVAANWLWNVSIVLSAINRFQLKLETLWARDDVHAAINEFVAQCTVNKYLEHAPPNEVHVSGNNLKEVIESLDQTAALLEYLGLATISDHSLTRLLKYRNALEVYDCIWNRTPLDFNSMPWSTMNLIDWQKVENALSDAHTQVQDTWLKDTFSVTKYISMANDVVFISMLYNLLNHFITYIKLRPWTTWDKIFRLFSPSIEDTLVSFMKCPTAVFKSFLKMFALSDDTFYLEVLEYMNDAKDKDRANFHTFTKIVTFKLEIYLKRFGLFDKNIYISMAENELPYGNNTECRNFFKQVFKTAVFIMPLNLNILDWFSMSENDTWLLDS